MLGAITNTVLAYTPNSKQKSPVPTIPEGAWSWPSLTIVRSAQSKGCGCAAGVFRRSCSNADKGYLVLDNSMEKRFEDIDCRPDRQDETPRILWQQMGDDPAMDLPIPD